MLFTACVVLASTLAAYCEEVAEQEKFFPIDLACPTATASGITHTKANSVGQYIRWRLLSGQLTVAGWGRGVFEIVVDVPIERVDQLSGDAREIAQGAAKLLSVLRQKVCEGTPEYRRRYDQMVQDFRRKTNSWPPPEAIR